ncbi:MAG: MBL fold metallo-hydrolase [Bacteroidales bacterium]|nr:MBL fold metallo-hydrolase [Bacteroidales bacterium]
MRSIFVSILLCMCCLFGCTAQTAYKTVSVEEFEKAISNDEVIILDVRTQEEYVVEHLAKSLLIDVKQPEFEQRALKSLPKEKKVAVYCRSGNRSKYAANILAKHGYTVIELGSGINGWKTAGKPVTKEECDVFQTKNGTKVKVFCIKHGSIRIEVNGKWIYVDPVSVLPPATDFSTMPKADVILITHEHFDHLDSLAIRQLTKSSTKLIVNPRSSELLGGKGFIMKNGDKSNIEKAIEIAAVPAYNKSAEKLQFHPKGRDNGYVLTIEGLRIYIAGDTEDIEEMSQLKNIDIAFLPCNLPYTMTPEQLANAARNIQPRILFPYHYGNTEIQQVVRLLNDTQIDVRIRQYQ